MVLRGIVNSDFNAEGIYIKDIVFVSQMLRKNMGNRMDLSLDSKASELQGRNPKLRLGVYHRYFAVQEALHFERPSKEPSYISSPPNSPASGPRSTM